MKNWSGRIVMISTVFKSKAAYVVTSLAVIYILMLIYNAMPLNIQKLFDLILLAGSPAERLYSPYMPLIVPVLLGMLCIPFAVRKWSCSLQ